MAERDKVIKSGQLTLPRILLLAVVGGIIVSTVYAGGVYLTVGYWLITLAVCALLLLIAIDYGVTMDKVTFTADPVQASAAPLDTVSATTPTVKTTLGEPKAKKRTSRPAKRRR